MGQTQLDGLQELQAVRAAHHQRTEQRLACRQGAAPVQRRAHRGQHRYSVAHGSNGDCSYNIMYRIRPN